MPCGFFWAKIFCANLFGSSLKDFSAEILAFWFFFWRATRSLLCWWMSWCHSAEILFSTSVPDNPAFSRAWCDFLHSFFLLRRFSSCLFIRGLRLRSETLFFQPFQTFQEKIGGARNRIFGINQRGWRFNYFVWENGRKNYFKFFVDFSPHFIMTWRIF